MPSEEQMASWPPRRRLRRRWKVLIALVVVFVVLPVGAWLVLDALGAAAVRREVEKIRAAGEATTWAELAPPPVPDDQNAAVVYMDAFLTLELDKRDTSSAYVKAVETEGPWDAERRKALVDALAGHGVKIDSDALTETAVWAEVGRYLRQEEETLALLRQAAAMEKCRFEVEWSQGMMALLPHLGPLRKSAELLDLSARWNHRNGDLPGAYADLVAVFRLHRAVREPCLVSCLVEIRTLGMACRRLQSFLNDGAAQPEAWRQLQTELEKIDLQKDFVLAIEGERMNGHSSFALLRSDPGQFSILQGGPPRGMLNRGTTFLWGPVLRFDEAQYLQHMSGMIAAARQPPLAAVRDSEQLEARIESAPRWAVMTRILTPALARSYSRCALAQTELAVARVALALRLFQHKTGAYPADLSALVPEFLPTMPIDPLSGKPLVYRREGSGFVLCSVGVDGVDDGGRMAAEPKKELDEGVDVVWKIGT
jgi:hypothetical protein